ncbi:hypothetical protein AYO41_03115 [Verrucomicrobia bacterium SCGC AG-212-E04]|nr:hypothetical protein AYO41_03115 [Verrucomicrobia bacterium SCGC AG-212-E04]
MRLLVPLLAAGLLVSGCTNEPEPIALSPDQARTLGTRLNESQKAYFVSAVLSTPTSKLDTELASKLVPLGAFSPTFNIYEIASTAYELVLERPNDMSRWRAVAKLDGLNDSVYGAGYQAARADALRRNPNLFNSCPEFAQWSAKYHMEMRNAG